MYIKTVVTHTHDQGFRKVFSYDEKTKKEVPVPAEIHLHIENWEKLGKPEQLTVTIEPGKPS